MYLERVHQALPTTLVVLVPLSLENVNCQFVIVSCHNVHKMTYNYAVYDVTLMLNFADLGPYSIGRHFYISKCR